VLKPKQCEQVNKKLTGMECAVVWWA